MNENRKKIPLYLSQKEIESLTKSIKKDKHRLGIFLMAYGGLRVSEMCGLRVNGLHLARGFLVVHGKGNKERIVPVNSRLQKEIENYLQKYGHQLGPDSLLVGGDRSSWHYAVKKYSSLNLGRSDVHCHTLRHSFATGLYENDVPIERISQILGHSKLDTTMIYSHISVEQKKEAVMTLDSPRGRLFSFFASIRKRTDISVKQYSGLVGRESELAFINKHVSNGVSVVLVGAKGCGKSAILKAVENSVYIDEFKKKQTLIRIILSKENIYDPAVYKEAEKELKKLSIDELIDQLKSFERVIVIDDITDLSKLDRKTVAKLSEVATVLASSSRAADKKLFKTFLDVKPLKRHHTRQVLSEMIHLNDPRKKELIVDDILHQSGDNLKDAEYIAGQLTLGKSNEEVVTPDRESNQVSIAPVLLIFVLFFVAYVLKSYATSMVAFSYALLVVFRLVFYRYIFMPAATNKRKA